MAKPLARNVSSRLPLLAACALLAACGSSKLPELRLPSVAPAQWQAPRPAAVASEVAALPHGGSVAQLLDWWRRQGDPVLVELIAASQQVSPSVASAQARLAQARASRVAADADQAPAVAASASATRGRSLQSPALPPQNATSAQWGLQASWELDLAGGLRAGSEAAKQRLQGARADWHEARVSVAAEVAVQYELLRQCRRLQDITGRDAASRAETARLSGLTSEAGFTPPAVAALARASAAEAAARARLQAAQCELDTKALVALTGWPEARLRERLAQAPAAESLALPDLQLDAVPARALAQRPDVYSAERAVQAARADLAATDAQRYPRLALTGFVGGASLSAGGGRTEAATWSLGPVSLSLPVLDAGRRAAATTAAQARYEEAAAQYAGRVRQAVREVESALVNLASSVDRAPQVKAAVAGYRASLAATESRYRGGLASLVELEDARRQLLAAETAEAEWQTQQRAAHVSLYRAVGGGWSPALLDDPQAEAQLERALRAASAAAGASAPAPVSNPAASPAQPR